MRSSVEGCDDSEVTEGALPERPFLRLVDLTDGLATANNPVHNFNQPVQFAGHLRKLHG